MTSKEERMARRKSSKETSKPAGEASGAGKAKREKKSTGGSLLWPELKAAIVARRKDLEKDTGNHIFKGDPY